MQTNFLADNATTGYPEPRNSGASPNRKIPRKGRHPLSDIKNLPAAKGAAIETDFNPEFPIRPLDFFKENELLRNTTQVKYIATKKETLPCSKSSPKKDFEKPAAVGNCKALGTKIGDKWVKPAYQQFSSMNSNKVINDALTNAFSEIIWGRILHNHLQENPLSIIINESTYHLDILTVDLNDEFKFEQAFAEPDSMPINLKKLLSREILKQLLPQLWRKGYYIFLDIKPDNFHIVKKEGSYQVQLFDWAFPSHLLGDDIFTLLNHHLKNTLHMENVENQTLQERLKSIVISNNTDAHNDELQTNSVYDRLTNELKPQWDKFLLDTKTAQDHLLGLVPVQRKSRSRPEYDKTFPHPLSYLNTKDNKFFMLKIAEKRLLDQDTDSDVGSSFFLDRLNQETMTSPMGSGKASRSRSFLDSLNDTDITASSFDSPSSPDSNSFLGLSNKTDCPSLSFDSPRFDGFLDSLDAATENSPTSYQQSPKPKSTGQKESAPFPLSPKIQLR